MSLQSSGKEAQHNPTIKSIIRIKNHKRKSTRIMRQYTVSEENLI